MAYNNKITIAREVPIPSWLLNLIVSLAIKVGLPYLIKLLPNLPQEIWDIVTKLIEDLQKPGVSNSAARKEALFGVKNYCDGVGCSSDTLKP